jgi:SAM-dependent methyltransferase
MRSILVNSGLYQEDAAGREQNSDWYDKVFAESNAYGLPYQQSHYYFLWCVVVDRIIRSGVTSVLDIGCGPGQVASFLRDKGLKKYMGIDWSSVAIENAKKICPEFEFLSANAFEVDAYKTFDYDAAISFEFLEHVEDELAILRRFVPGTRFWGTVPNFECSSHVRHFNSCDEVLQRYNPVFTSLTVDAFDAPDKSHQFFLLEGVCAGQQ